MDKAKLTFCESCGFKSPFIVKPNKSAFLSFPENIISLSEFSLSITIFKFLYEVFPLFIMLKPSKVKNFASFISNSLYILFLSKFIFISFSSLLYSSSIGFTFIWLFGFGFWLLLLLTFWTLLMFTWLIILLALLNTNSFLAIESCSSFIPSYISAVCSLILFNCSLKSLILLQAFFCILIDKFENSVNFKFISFSISFFCPSKISFILFSKLLFNISAYLLLFSSKFFSKFLSSNISFIILSTFNSSIFILLLNNFSKSSSLAFPSPSNPPERLSSFSPEV